MVTLPKYVCTLRQDDLYRIGNRMKLCEFVLVPNGAKILQKQQSHFAVFSLYQINRQANKQINFIIVFSATNFKGKNNIEDLN